jgi:class 3 adenylate cyclase
VKIISSGGGDVLKFAGDAMIVLWPDDSADGIVDRLQRAAQCAVYIQQKLDQVRPRRVVGLGEVRGF